MNGNLVIVINDDNNVDLIFGTSKFSVASAVKNCKKIDELEYFLQSFMSSNNIEPRNIKNVIFVIDFTGFMEDIKNPSFGYIQIGDVPNNRYQAKKFMKNIKLNIHNFNVPSFNSTKYKDQLERYLDLLFKKGIYKIALNNFFSTLNSDREKRLMEYINNMYPNFFKIYPSHSYGSFNYLLRENAMLLDLLLSESVNDFIDSIDRIFYNLNINAGMYFLKGDGTLTSLRIASVSPISTWQSLFALQLISGGIASGEKDAFVLTNYNNGVKIGIIQNNLPKPSETFSNYKGLHIPNYFPRSSFFNTLPDNKKLCSILKSNNIFTGPVPVISYLDSLNSYSLFTYPLKIIENHPAVIGQGALSSFFQLELTSIVVSSDTNNINKEKEKLINKSSKILQRDNISLKSVNYIYELTPIKYRLENAFYVKLYVKGKLSL